MKKIIRLTESDLMRIVKRVISEQKPDAMMSGQPSLIGDYVTNSQYVYTTLVGMSNVNFLAIQKGTKFTYDSSKNRVIGFGILGLATKPLFSEKIDIRDPKSQEKIGIYFSCSEKNSMKFKPINPTYNSYEIFAYPMKDQEIGRAHV